MFHYKFMDRLSKEMLYIKIMMSSSAIQNMVFPEDYLIAKVKHELKCYCTKGEVIFNFVTMDQMEKVIKDTKDAIEAIKARI